MSEFEREGVSAKVADLNLDSRRVNVVGKVVSVGKPRDVISRRDGTSHSVADVTIGDETGTVILTLWDDNIGVAKEGSVLAVRNGYVSLFRGSIRLNVGRYGGIEKSEQDIPEVKTDNNISEKVYEERGPRFGGRERQGFRGRGGFRRRY